MLTNEHEEQKIQESLYELVKSRTSFRFNAGAGAGKTYALVEVLKFLLSNNLDTLSKRNQNIYCVTYTNVAVNEIKNRLGNTDTVIVSTIHEMLWKVIKQHQLELVKCHLEKLKYELKEVNDDLSGESDNKSFSFYCNLTSKNKEIFEELVESTKDIFYKTKDSGLRDAYKELQPLTLGKADLVSCLKNIANFKKVTKAIYKKNRYEKCIKNIEEKNPKYTEVLYDNVFNSDRLDKMRFSHDTLLEYAKELIVGNDILKRIIIDKYPFIFIDEYQDTSEPVVEIMAAIHQYAISKNKHWVVGYFGDTAQNIYGDGVGKNIINIHSELTDVNKKFNRRSHKQIVDVANSIRNDEIKQSLLDDKKNKGIFNIYNFIGTVDKDKENKIVQEFIRFYTSKFSKSNKDTKVDCLVLTNELVAKLNGFGSLYDDYKKNLNIYYKDQSQGILSHEVNKLNVIVRMIFNITNACLKVNNEKSTYYDVFGENGKKLKFSSIKPFLDYMHNLTPKTLDDLVNSLSDFYDFKENREPFEVFINNALDWQLNDNDKHNDFSSIFKGQLIELIELNKKNEDFSAIETVDKLLNINMEELELWAKYINREQDGDIRYHTYHGTKGEEYENVIVIMEHSFGRMNKDKFKSFFEIRGVSEEERKKKLKNMNDIKEFESTQNLVYVACSRAIKNLAILYLDDIKEIKIGLENVFGEIQEWSPE
ncbi:UvrD-helicase domain-containing protein [Providencia rettgeri]|uniref:UvrD-helicase domain-containing protein n=1 Tax=Providencia TaxID=586 RepID=UPI00137417C5|nr:MULTISPECIES: UvrD-helicase domain-containing protein [Providencia]MBW3105878.1 UvrD-helicase domain-containing protein [Providencia rettgeri]BBU94507.1 DNA helicase [Providencia rettgeri]